MAYDDKWAYSVDQASSSSSFTSAHLPSPSSTASDSIVQPVAGPSRLPPSPPSQSASCAPVIFRELKPGATLQSSKPRPLPSVPRHSASMASLRPSTSKLHSHSSSVHSLSTSARRPPAFPSSSLPPTPSLSHSTASPVTPASAPPSTRAPASRPLPPTPSAKPDLDPLRSLPIDRRPQLAQEEPRKASTLPFPRPSAPSLSVDTSSSCLHPSRPRRGRSASSPTLPSPSRSAVSAEVQSPLSRVSLDDLRPADSLNSMSDLSVEKLPSLVIDTVHALEFKKAIDDNDDGDDEFVISAIEFAPPTPIPVERHIIRDKPAQPCALSSLRPEPPHPRTKRPHNWLPALPRLAKFGHGTKDEEAAARRASRVWFREKRGQRWVDEDYQGIVAELRMLR